MFLTGKLSPRPWEEPPKLAQQIKDRNFYHAKDNIWNNPHRSSKKVSKYYHVPESIFKQTHYSDQELLSMQTKEAEVIRKNSHLAHRLSTKERLHNRKIEREILQFKSDQPVTEEKFEEVGDLAIHQPVFFNEMALKRYHTDKDPEKSKQPNMQLWNLINQCPTSQISKVVRPKILQMDQNACNHITQKLQEEKQQETIQKKWFEVNRQEIRQKLLERHEQNIQLEKKSGVRKDYISVREHTAQSKVLARGGHDVSSEKQSRQTSSRPVSAYNILSQNSNNQLQRKKQSYVTNPENTMHRIPEQSDQDPVTFRIKQQSQKQTPEQKQELHDTHTQPSESAEDNDSPNQEELQISELEQPPTQQNFASQKARTIDASRPVSQSKHSDFRISTITKPNFYKTNKQIEKLTVPKKAFEPAHPFMHSEFRGLLNADFREALKSCHIYDTLANQREDEEVNSLHSKTMQRSVRDISTANASQRIRAATSQGNRQREPQIQGGCNPSSMGLYTQADIKSQKLMVKRPLTAYKTVQSATPSIRCYNQEIISNQGQLAPNQIEIRKPNRAQSSFRTQQSTKPVDIETELEKEECFQQMNQFELRNGNKDKRNKYPKIQFEEALDFHKRFAEHLASKKANQGITGGKQQTARGFKNIRLLKDMQSASSMQTYKNVSGLSNYGEQ